MLGAATEPLNMYTSVFGLNRLNQSVKEGSTYRASSFTKKIELMRYTGSAEDYTQDAGWFKTDKGMKSLWEVAETFGIFEVRDGNNPRMYVGYDLDGDTDPMKKSSTFACYHFRGI